MTEPPVASDERTANLLGALALALADRAGAAVEADAGARRAATPPRS